MALVSLIRVGSAALILSERGNGVSETRDPEVVASSGGYYTVQESAPEVDPARRSVPGPVTGYGAFPAPGDPGAPAPGMVPEPMMAPAPVKVSAPSGAEAWCAGLFGLLAPLPILDVLLAMVAMIVVGLWNKKDLREPARTNRRLAASWGLTLLLVELALIAIQIAVASIANDVDESPSFMPWGTPIMMALGMVVVHVLVCSVQAIRAYRGTTLRFGGFPFFH
mgnify:FL=1